MSLKVIVHGHNHGMTAGIIVNKDPLSFGPKGLNNDAGKSYNGRTIVIEGGRITVDGVVQDGDMENVIQITINGHVELLETQSGSVTANDVGTIKTMSGNVKCGNVQGSVSTQSGFVKCHQVGGNVETQSGNVSFRSDKSDDL